MIFNSLHAVGERLHTLSRDLWFRTLNLQCNNDIFYVLLAEYPTNKVINPCSNPYTGACSKFPFGQLLNTL